MRTSSVKSSIWMTQIKIIPGADRNVKVNHTHHLLLLDRKRDVHPLFLTAPLPRLAFPVPTAEVAEIAAAVTSLWE